MSLFVGISSCDRYEKNGWNWALRNTWLTDLRELGIDYKFFVGIGAESKDDNVIVNAGDDYFALFHKTLEKFKWVYDKGYDNLFHCYHDTYACAGRLLENAGKADYFGDYFHADARQPFPHYSYGNSCQSGQGVFISRKALKVVIDEMPAVIAQHPTVWEEDFWSGKIISGHPELLIQDSRNMPCNLTLEDPGPRFDNCIISVHLSTIFDASCKNDSSRESEARYRPEYMYKMHEEWKACPKECLKPPEPIVAVPSISFTPDTSASFVGRDTILARSSRRLTPMHL